MLNETIEQTIRSSPFFDAGINTERLVFNSTKNLWYRKNNGKSLLSMQLGRYVTQKIGVTKYDILSYSIQMTGGRCYWCGANLMEEHDGKTVVETHGGIDHVWPVASYGLTTIGNLMVTCPACNQAKQDYSPLVWYDLAPNPLGATYEDHSSFIRLFAQPLIQYDEDLYGFYTREDAHEYNSDFVNRLVRPYNGSTYLTHRMTSLPPYYVYDECLEER
jgi:hypothetical protein